MIACLTHRFRRAISCGVLQSLVALAVVPLIMAPSTARATDHADPIRLKDLEAGITGLFAFTNRQAELVLILCVRRGLTDAKSLDLAPFRFAIHLDQHSEVNFDQADLNARYGGHIVKPDGISPDITLQFALNNDATLLPPSVSGIADTNSVRFWSGVRDDPFIFFDFFGRNVIAVVATIPLGQLKRDRLDFVVWGTSERAGRQIDHVGRSLRTMQPRFDALNTLPPNQHARYLRERHENPNVLQDILTTRVSPYYGLRSFDFEPDVMILSLRRPIGFPNGRLLTDDIPGLCCELGDCLLFEVSYASAAAAGQKRPTRNDKEFLDDFPYLAEPWPNRPQPPVPELRTRTLVILGSIIVGVILFIAFPWILWWRCRIALARAHS